MNRENSPTPLQPTGQGTVGPVTVIGAGVVGACIALSLQRAGCQVTLIDALQPGSGASYGNAGLISVDSCLPISLPGMVWQTPRWLLDPAGPLAIRPAYLPQIFPWLVRWLLAGRRQRVLDVSQALHALHKPSMGLYEDFLGKADCERFIRVTGQAHLWTEAGAPSAADRLVGEVRQRQGIHVKPLNVDQIFDLLPDMARTVVHGISFERHAHCVNPQAMVQALVGHFQAQGGQLHQGKVQLIEHQAGNGYRLWTNAGSSQASRVVVAGGIHAKKLLGPLGVELPIESERGYHLELPDPRVHVPIPFIHKNLAVAVTPMQNGLRFAGTVEFAGVDHPPNPLRTEALLRVAQTMFPGINVEGARTWQGHRPSTPDSLPIIDALSEYPGLFVACGHGHTGMTGAPMTSQLITARVTGAAPPIDPTPYTLSRFA